jgi:hypothetical protein
MEVVMLNLFGSIAGFAAVGVDLVAILAALELSPGRRLALAAIVGGWVGLASDLGASGALGFAPDSPTPLIGVMASAPLLVVGALALASRGFRAALMAIPTSLLIGLNAMRVLGVMFLLLALAGRLAGPFPFSAGLGDIITGVFAIPLALSVLGSRALPRAAIASWNAFGALDLFAAIFFGLTSANGSPVQLIHWGVGSQAMQELPFCLVPTVLVPFYLITHFIIAAQLAAARRPAAALSHA